MTFHTFFCLVVISETVSLSWEELETFEGWFVLRGGGYGGEPGTAIMLFGLFSSAFAENIQSSQWDYIGWSKVGKPEEVLRVNGCSMSWSSCSE